MTRTRLASRWQMAGADMLRSDAPEAPDLIVIDLGDADALDTLAAERARHPKARIICFGPHVKAEALRAARFAGADETLARGRVAEQVLKRLQKSA